MASGRNDDYYKEAKTILCMSAYGELLNSQGYQIIGCSKCKFGKDCTKAHKLDELHELDYYRKWYLRDKSSIDIYKMRSHIIDVLKSGLDLVKKIEYRQKIIAIESLYFVELLKFWYDITCYHRKIIKEFNQKRHTSTFIEGYNDKRQVPGFYLENEDDVWPLERTLHMCEQMSTLSKDRVIHIRDVCCGNNNCKFGVHDKKYLVCIDDMMTGKCSCDSMSVFTEKKAKMKEEALSIKKQLEIGVDENGFKITLSPENKIVLTKQFNVKVVEFNNYVRLTHLTENGLVPFSVREIEYNKTKPTEETIPTVKAVTKLVKPGKK
jgi:hypothetical protein